MKRFLVLCLAVIMMAILTGCSAESEPINDTPSDIFQPTNHFLADVPADPSPEPQPVPDPAFDLSDVPAYGGDAYYIVNDDTPFFTGEDLTTESFETYSELDDLGRCGVAYACLGKDLMPTEPRGEIGRIKPSGWHTARYDDIIADKYLYNRCHLIGFQLAGENDNERNLITGTRAMNVEGMLPFENRVADYLETTDNHVLYRVTPVFRNDNLVADGVLIEAYSVEDRGQGICFCVWCYNVQPGVIINYATGESDYDPDWQPRQYDPEVVYYVLNTKTKRFHLTDCKSVQGMNPDNRKNTDRARESLVAEGYIPCGICRP